jgi:DNA-binding NtrC family response regulator
MSAPGRSAMLVSGDPALRQGLAASLTAMRWRVSEAGGGAEAMGQMESQPPEVLVLDLWLPDLEAVGFAAMLTALHPELEVVWMDGTAASAGVPGPRRNELLQALREASAQVGSVVVPGGRERLTAVVAEARHESSPNAAPASLPGAMPIAGMLGQSAAMLELARLIRLVAPTSATVLIEGETGSGKEVVAQAVHRLSARARKPIVVLNCAAIPEALLEAELFGHARGAFTGAVSSRTGRIEAADGGTLFLDEIGEMPLALQAKLLRFLECGELQRIGDNDTVQVDVRVVAATHQHLEQRVEQGLFRLDLYHRLAVFPVEVPPLREHLEDLPALTEHLLAELGKRSPRKRLADGVMGVLQRHNWPGNVRELAHVLERATILAGASPVLEVEHIVLRAGRREVKGS